MKTLTCCTRAGQKGPIDRMRCDPDEQTAPATAASKRYCLQSKQIRSEARRLGAETGAPGSAQQHLLAAAPASRLAGASERPVKWPDAYFGPGARPRRLSARWAASGASKVVGRRLGGRARVAGAYRRQLFTSGVGGTGARRVGGGRAREAGRAKAPSRCVELSEQDSGGATKHGSGAGPELEGRLRPGQPGGRPSRALFQEVCSLLPPPLAQVSEKVKL
jgi:hypothetical protein